MNRATELHEQGIALARGGDVRGALRLFDAALELDSNQPVWHFNRGLSCQRLGRLDAAAVAYQHAVRLEPGFFDAWSNLCAALKAAGRPGPAVEAGLRAIQLNRESAGALINLGNAQKAFGDWPGAEGAYRRALVLEPGNPRAGLNLANTLREDGRLPEAVAMLREVVRRSPDFAEAHRDLAFALLLSGNLPEGWRENEWRWKTGDLVGAQRSYPSASAWTGEEIPGRTLFLYTEQGYGDAIQFFRYVRLAAQRAGRVVVECQPALRRLFDGCEGVSQLVVRGEHSVEFDFFSPFLSLPNVFGTELETIPAPVCYLQADRGIEARVPVDPARVNVGVVWAGNPSHLNDARRSVPFEIFRRILESESVRFYSLQAGARGEELQRAGLGERVVDLATGFTDFADTAAAMDRLDLVVTVDTSVAHLAGAMGKPVWLLLPFAPDWRWLLGRETSSWYPSLRLYRQPARDGWGAVVERIKAELERVVVDRPSR